MDMPQLLAFFKDAELPQTLKLDAGRQISNVRLFVDTHSSILELHGNTQAFRGMYNDLVQLHSILTAS